VVRGSSLAAARLLGPTLCLVVLLVILLAVVFTAWISLTNFSSIGV
jgi:ABC-type sugar transport system permease subunit